MTLKLTTPLAAKIILWIVLWVLLALFAAPLMAATDSTSRISRSISFSSNSTIDKTVRDEQLKQVQSDIMAPLLTQGYRPEATTMALQIESTRYISTADIYIYDASTYLITDFNNDGFYHRFSVVIDADTTGNTAYVYARLYLSYEGGPWNHYATSDAYTIYADSEHDAFTIETELADGFIPGYYDIRIELYDADTDAWLFSYGPYDDASLSALPLQDSFFDDSARTAYYPPETEVVVVGHGHGSMSFWLLLVPVLMTLGRRFTNKTGIHFQ